MLLHGARKAQRGLSVVDFLILATAIAALVRLSVPNFYEFRRRAADASAYAVYQEVRETLSSKANAPTALIFNQRGPGSLPSPFSKISISDQIRVNYIVSLHYPGMLDVSALEVSHDMGGHYYRMIWINEKRIEQVIAR